MQSQKSFYKCCVDNCNNTTRNSQYKFHSFPTKNPVFPEKVARRLAWIKALKKQESDGSPWTPRKRSKICSYHFAGGAKSEHPESPNYNPTIFNSCQKTKANAEIAVNRFKRRLKRSLNKTASPQTEVIKGAKLEANIILVIQCLKEESPVNEYPTSDVATQVSLEVTDEIECDIFICIKYNFENTCHAEIQANRHVAKKGALSNISPVDQEFTTTIDTHNIKKEV